MVVARREPQCQQERRKAGLAYPRTCQLCGLGPCHNGARPAPISEADKLKEAIRSSGTASTPPAAPPSLRRTRRCQDQVCHVQRMPVGQSKELGSLHLWRSVPRL
jgi:hypothetical protein